MSDETPQPRRPEDLPPARSQADLHRLWLTLMGELGFATPQLWMVILDPEGRCTPVVQHLEDLPDTPDEPTIANLMLVCRGILDEVIPGGSVAFLRARPGSAGLTAADRSWAAAISTAAREHEVACRPVHLANDHEIRAFAPDDEIASA